MVYSNGFCDLVGFVREWSLFMAGGGGGILKIARTQNLSLRATPVVFSQLGKGIPKVATCLACDHTIDL